MTHPCKDCTRPKKRDCICDKYVTWFEAVWAEIQVKFAEIAKGK